MCKGDTVAWHLLGLGTESDVHGVMFQGNTVQLQGMRKSAAMLFPHTFAMAIMQPDNPGKYLSSWPYAERLCWAWGWVRGAGEEKRRLSWKVLRKFLKHSCLLPPQYAVHVMVIWIMILAAGKLE